jgi:uncharacterized damage-inducible protein DinB
MNLDDIRTLYRYNEWAHRRLLDAISALRPEELTQDLGGSFKTIRDVTAHVVSTEWSWLERWGGMSPTAAPDWVDNGDMNEIVAKLREVEAKRAQFFETVSDSDMSRPIEFRYLSGQPGVHALQELMIHVVNHSTYHRGQIASMLRQLGSAPPSTDFVVFRAET